MTNLLLSDGRIIEVGQVYCAEFPFHIVAFVDDQRVLVGHGGLDERSVYDAHKVADTELLAWTVRDEHALIRGLDLGLLVAPGVVLRQSHEDGSKQARYRVRPDGLELTWVDEEPELPKEEQIRCYRDRRCRSGWRLVSDTDLVTFRHPLDVWKAPTMVECEACKRRPDEVNHPAGMIFVGWGMGWQWCTACGGSQKVPAKEPRS